MKKYSWYFILFTFLTLSTVAQELPYALQQAQLPIRVITGTFPAYNMNESFVDGNGNTYITGYFKGTSDFDPSATDAILSSQSPSVNDAFLAKYDAQGNLLYVKSIAGTLDKQSNTIALTTGGKVVIAGYFLGTANFDPTATNFTLVSNGGSDAFMCRYDAATGAFETAVSLGGFGNDGIMEVVTDVSNQNYLYGYFAQTMDFDPSGATLEYTSTTLQDRFIAKYDASFLPQWAHPFATLFVTSLAVDASGFYATGSFSVSTDMDPGPATLTKAPAGNSDIWLSKFDGSGNLVWNNVVGGQFFENAVDLALDANSEIIITGNFNQTCDFDPSAVTQNLVSNGLADAYAAKYDTNGNFIWAKGWGGSAADQANSLVAMQNNQLAIVGNYQSLSMDMDPGAGTRTVTNAGPTNFNDVFILLLNASGTFLEAQTYGVASINETAGLINANATQFSVVGNFTTPVDFDPSTDVVSISNPGGQQQGYLNRYSLLAPLPAAQPTALVLNNPTGSSIDVSFTGSGANGYIVVRRSNAASATQPKDGKTYTTGSFLSDAVVAYAGASTSFTDINLAANTTYYYSVFAFNNTAGSPNYLGTAPLTGNSATTAITYTRTTDSLALIQLYNSTLGIGWTNNTNWATGYINTWYGVTVTGNRVTAISLPNNNLIGYLPSALANLTALITLDINTNILTGSVPSELSSIVSLQNLVLHNNELSGLIPKELGLLPSLINLNVAFNKFTGTIPLELASIGTLQILDLFGNQVTGTIPTILATLSNLTYLSLGGNLLTGNIPTELGNITTLTFLSLAQNQLTGSIPTSLGNITNLQSLYLNSNQFTGSIPTQLGNLSNLTLMDIGGNQLTGTIPVSLFSIPGLQTLGIARNQLTGTIPVEITTATSLAYFWADNNQLTGAFPSMTSTTNPAIDGLTIDRNQLSSLPDLSSLNGLVSYLSVNNNNFTFEDLELNVGISGITFIPQNLVGLADTLTINAGSPLNLSFTVGGSANTYQWKKNVSTNVGTNSTTFSIPALSITDAGTYILTTTNSLVPGLTLTSANQVVIVKAEGVFEWVTSAGDLTTEGFTNSVPPVTDQNYSGSWGDFNNDGFEDLFVGGIATQERSYIYKNNGNGTFSKLPISAYAFSAGRSMTWADYNNDGWLDAFAPAGIFAPDSAIASFILKNNGNETFTKISLPGNPTTTAGTWADTDNDGDVDLIVNGGSGFPTLYRNDGNDSFVPLSAFTTNQNSQWNIIAIDVNKDARMDIYIPDDTQRNFYENDGGNNFILNTYSPLTTDVLNGARGVAWADIDNDGDFDAYLMGNSVGNLFYINDGYGGFTQQSSLATLGETIFGGRGSAFADYDNDGYIDLISVQNQVPSSWYLYRNNGNGTFTKQLNQSFKGASAALAGGSFGDYNNDGFLDFITASFGADYNALYRNVGNTNKYLKVKLIGSTTNRNGIGAVVSVKAGGFWRHHQVLTANGFANQNSLLAHFGLGSSTTADSVVVQWPSGYRQVLLNRGADQVLTINEPLNPISDTDMEVISAHQIRSQDANSSSGIEDFTLDGSDNMLLTGYFEGNVDFDPTAGNAVLTSSVNGEESFIAKYTSTGSLAWVYGFPNPDSNSSLEHNAIDADASGNVFVAGQIRGTHDVDPGAGVITITSSSSGDPYFAKYTPAGAFVWAMQLVNTSSVDDAELETIAIDNAGNIIVAGNFRDGTLDMDPSGASAILTSSDSYSDVFIGKYDNNGNSIWSLKIGTDGVYDFSPSLTTDSQNNIYLSYSIDDATGQQIIVKYNPSGTQLWSVTNQNVSNAGLRDLKLEEATNRLYVMGEYENTPSFTGTSGSGTLPTAGNDADVGFVAAYDLNGAFINAFGFQTSNETYPVSINTLDDGNLLITGGFEGTADLDPSAGKYETYYPESSFITKITPAGSFIWAANIPKSFGLISELNSQNELASVLIYNNTVVDVEPGPGVVNITTITNEEEFSIIRYDIQGGVLGADSLALEAFYNATGGPNWTTKTNWLSGKVNTWFGVTVTNDRITAINLPNNNLTGSIPDGTLILNDLTSINVSNNILMSVPDFSPLDSGTVVNISNNNLDFGSLEYNMDVSGINYLNQKPITIASDSILVASGDDYTLTTNIGGTANAYQWQRNTVNIATATADSILIENIGRSNMGSYSLSVTNSLVPNLILNAIPVTILATADLSGKLLMPSAPATAGYVRLLRVTSSNGYDTVRTQVINATGDYAFNQVVLDDYQIVGFADTLVVGQERALPTYYEGTIYWEEADTLFVENSLNNLNIVSLLEPLETPQGSGEIAGIVQEDDGTGSRTEKTRRVGGAGVSARRAQGTGRGSTELGELVAYVFTDEEGYFSMPGLPPGIYRINIQYPGYPMDPNSFIDIPIGTTALDERVSLEAIVAEGKITVRQLVITHLEGDYVADAYPNPTSGKVTITFEKIAKERVLTLVDTQGRDIVHTEANEKVISLDMNTLEPGLYLIKVIDGGRKVKTIRVSVQ